MLMASKVWLWSDLLYLTTSHKRPPRLDILVVAYGRFDCINLRYNKIKDPNGTFLLLISQPLAL